MDLKLINATPFEFFKLQHGWPIFVFEIYIAIWAVPMALALARWSSH
jgi:hypothetical protein